MAQVIQPGQGDAPRSGTPPYRHQTEAQQGRSKNGFSAAVSPARPGVATGCCIFLSVGSVFLPRELPAPGQAALDRRTVEVWFTRLDLGHKAIERARALLSADESERAQGMASAPQHRFVAARALLRRLLAAYLGTDPGGIEFAYGRKGKPHLAGQHADTRLRFNVSHSGDWALVAIGMSPLGIDLERLRPVRDIEALAARFFAPRERLTLHTLPASEKQGGFFACWTRKEAYVKALGEGLVRSLKNFEVVFAPGLEPAILARGGSRKPGWALHHLEPERGLLGALAVRGRACGVRCFRLEPPSRIALGARCRPATPTEPLARTHNPNSARKCVS